MIRKHTTDNLDHRVLEKQNAADLGVATTTLDRFLKRKGMK